MRILWASDCIVPTGYGRVANEIIPRLQRRGHEINVLAVNYKGDPHDMPIRAYPAGAVHPSDPFGFERIVELTVKLNPELVFVLNDPWHVHTYMQKLEQALGHKRPPIIAYTPIDAINYTHESANSLNKCEAVITYTEFSKRELERAGVTKKIHIVPHGINLEDFTVYDKQFARKSLGIPEDWFVVINYNKNQSRKNIPSTVEGFIEFCKKAIDNGADPEKLCLYLNMMPISNEGWVLPDVISNAIRDTFGKPMPIKVAFPEQGANFFPQNVLCLILSACDVGINTASAGGWELTSFEGANYCPQVVPDNSCFSEIWNVPQKEWDSRKYPEYPGAGVVVPIWDYRTIPMFSVRHAFVRNQDVAEALWKLYSDKEFYKEMFRRGKALVQQKRFNWDVITKQIEDIIISAVSNKIDVPMDDWHRVMETA